LFAIAIVLCAIVQSFLSVASSTGCAKTWPNFFCQQFIKSLLNLVVFGIQIAKMIEIC